VGAQHGLPPAWLDRHWGESEHGLSALGWLGEHGDAGRAAYVARGTLPFWADRSGRSAILGQRAHQHGSFRRGLTAALGTDYRFARMLRDACWAIIAAQGCQQHGSASAAFPAVPRVLRPLGRRRSGGAPVGR
jgi:hypothetical protein